MMMIILEKEDLNDTRIYPRLSYLHVFWPFHLKILSGIFQLQTT